MREEIARVVPFYDGVQRLKKTGDAVQYGGPHLCADWKFPTPDGKAHFRTVPLPPLAHSAGEFHLSTRRGKLFNTLIYDEIDPLTGAGRDALPRGFKAGAHAAPGRGFRFAVILRITIFGGGGGLFVARLQESARAISSRMAQPVSQPSKCARSGKQAAASSRKIFHSARASPTWRGISGLKIMRRSVVVSVPPSSCS